MRWTQLFQENDLRTFTSVFVTQLCFYLFGSKAKIIHKNVKKKIQCKTKPNGSNLFKMFRITRSYIFARGWILSYSFSPSIPSLLYQFLFFSLYKKGKTKWLCDLISNVQIWDKGRKIIHIREIFYCAEHMIWYTKYNKKIY